MTLTTPSPSTATDRPGRVPATLDADTLARAFLAASGSAPVIEAPLAPSRAREAVPPGLGLRKFRDALPIPPRLHVRPGRTLRVRATPARVRLHADLPEVAGWGYEGSVPGPTIIARRGQPAVIDWINDLGSADAPAHLPFDVVRVPLAPSGAPDVARALAPGGHSTDRGAGPEAFPPLPGTAALRAATVVHLHGALTNGHNDGWAHNVALPGTVTRCQYPNDQPAATLWYHDHAMAVTRFNVHAGLAGMYWIRDDVEDALGLPSGRREIPLVLADRNLETSPPDASGRTPFTGRPLYKHAAFAFGPGQPLGEIPVTGPFNTVNGRIWPTLDVDAAWYRFRVVNGSGARTYHLALHETTDEPAPSAIPVPVTDPAFGTGRTTDRMVVIGTEGGLLAAPYTPPGGVIELGPGERLDLLIDFSAARGRRFELRNENATALHARPGQADATIMQFSVSTRRCVDRFRLPRVLDAGHRRYHHPDQEHAHVWIGLVPPGLRGGLHPEMWELAEVPPGEPVPDHDVIRLAKPDGGVRVLHPVARLFDDVTSIFIEHGQWAVWNFVHLGGPDHPMHIHMAEFQMMNRWAWPVPRPGGTLPGFDLATGTTPQPLPPPAPGRPIDDLGWGMKDTWLIKAGEWVQVQGRFSGATGSFMYHCHILDHEDHTMMRPFVVLPRDLLAFHKGHGGGHH